MMPGGTGAGTILGLECFLIMFNEAGPAANLSAIDDIITQPLTWRQPITKCKVKWIDDMTVCAAVDSRTLVPEDRQLPQPVPYHGRTGHRLPPPSNTLQLELDQLKVEMLDNKMSINTLKTKAMFCNTWRKYDMIPELLKLVGFMFRNDLKTCSNTSYIIKKAYKRMWIVRRLKALGASTQQLLDVLNKASLVSPLLRSTSMVWPVDSCRKDSSEQSATLWAPYNLRRHL